MRIYGFGIGLLSTLMASVAGCSRIC